MGFDRSPANLLNGVTPRVGCFANQVDFRVVTLVWRLSCIVLEVEPASENMWILLNQRTAGLMYMVMVLWQAEG